MVALQESCMSQMKQDSGTTTSGSDCWSGSGLVRHSCDLRCRSTPDQTAQDIELL